MGNKSTKNSSQSSSTASSVSTFEIDGTLLLQPTLSTGSQWQINFKSVLPLLKGRVNLSEKELIKLAGVCKHWRCEIYRPIKRIDFNGLCEKGLLTDRVLSGIALGVGPNLKKIDITEVEELFYENPNVLYQSHEGLASIGVGCTLLEELIVPIPLNADLDSMADMTEPLLNIMKTCKNLKRLNLSNHKFGESVFVEMSRLTQLEKVVLAGGPTVTGLPVFKSSTLTALSIGSSDYKFLDKKFVETTHKQINDDLIKKIASNFPRLNTLEIFCAINVTDAAIKELVSANKQLVTVRITGYEREKEEASSMDPSSARIPPGITSKSLEPLALCKNLLHLEVLHLNELGKDDLVLLEKLLGSCPNLTHVAFSKVNGTVQEKIRKKFPKVKLIAKS